MKKIPVWQDIKKNRNYPSLKENIDVDVLIIGGGITGSNTFYQFKDTNLKVALVEKNKVGMGCSSRSSAKITFLQEDIYTKLSKSFDRGVSFLYYKSQKEAIKLIKDIVEKENIDCDLKEVKSYLYTHNYENINKIKKEGEFLKSFGEKVEVSKMLPNKVKVKEGISLSDTYLFHPLKYINSLIEKSITTNNKVYEDTTIIKIEKVNNLFKCYTKNNIITTKYVVLALHYPYFLIPYLMPLKCYLEKSYLGLTDFKSRTDFSAINIEKPLFSFRSFNDKLLTVSESKNLAFSSNNKKIIENFFKNTKNNNYDYLWSNHDLITLDKLPLIGFIDENLLIATGYNTWGNSNGLIASIIIKDLILGKDNKYKKIFDPKRSFSTNKFINYPINIFSNSYSFISSKINKNKSFYQGNPYFTKKDGKDIAIYKDSNGKKHIVYNRCPHLKCGLIFNEVEKTWDCPCHGSRFDLDGKSLMGPSNYDISYK